MNVHSLRGRARGLVLSLMLVAALLLPGVSTSQGLATSPVNRGLVAQTITLPPGAEVITEQPQGKKSVYPRLSAQLDELYESAVLGQGRPLETFAGQQHIDLAAGRARVILEMDVDPQAQAAGPSSMEKVTLPDGRRALVEHAAPVAIRSDLARAIGTTGATYELAVGDLVQVLAPFGSLKALSEIAGVRRVRLPYPARTLVGSATTEGVNLTNASAWQTAGNTGAGVSAAVFDFGFTGWAALQTSGDLPPDPQLVRKAFTSAYSFSPDTPGDEHGAACAEIVYDMAPGATLYLYAWNTDAEFANAVNDYINNVNGNRVATMSIGWVNAGPYDGTGGTTDPDTIVSNAAASGIFWANAAGNEQKEHDSFVSAQYSTGDTVAFGTGNVEGVGPSVGSLWVIPSGTVLEFFLEWNDWNSARTGNQNHIDYDLLLYRSTGGGWSFVTSSTSNQCTGSAPPTEEIVYTTTGNRTYGLVIQRNQGGGSCPNSFGHWLDLYTFNGFYQPNVGEANAFWYINPCNSLAIPADADGVMAVGASFWGEDSDSTHAYGLETFSSLGPRNASGGAQPGSTDVNKPDVVAPDGVSTATYGASNNQAFRISTSTGFFGTSAASPHLAGMAATLWSANPSWTAATLRTSIESMALYKADGTCGGGGSGNQNNTWGWGRIDLPAPTSVDVVRFEGWAVRKGIHLEWEMASESGNLGFNLYRASEPDGPYTRLNAEPIPGQAPGQPDGATYVWTDAEVGPARVYYYKLECLDIYGTTTSYGPVDVKSAPAAPGTGTR